MEMIRQKHHERLRSDFAKRARDFIEWISSAKSNINVEGFASLGELQDKLADIEQKFDDREAGKQKLQVLEELNQLLIDAHITDLSSSTEHSMQSLMIEYEQYESDLKSKIELLENKVAALKMSELKPEQIEEFKVTFSHFDVDKDNLLNPFEFRAGCKSLGIDLTVSTICGNDLIIVRMKSWEVLLKIWMFQEMEIFNLKNLLNLWFLEHKLEIHIRKFYLLFQNLQIKR
jgi:hypothetical protein